MHLLIKPDGRVHLQTPASKDFYRPSIDIAMTSAAEAYGAAAIGVVLTGIGNDGSEGLKQIRDAGGEGFVQDIASCIVPSMPERALAARGRGRRRQPGAPRSGPVFAEETVVTGDGGLVCCSVGDKQYALRGGDVRQIVRVEKMRTVAGSDGSVGTLELAGQAGARLQARQRARTNGCSAKHAHLRRPSHRHHRRRRRTCRLAGRPRRPDTAVAGRADRGAACRRRPSRDLVVRGAGEGGRHVDSVARAAVLESAVVAAAARERDRVVRCACGEEARRFGRTDRAAVLDAGLAAMRGAALCA